MVDVDPVTESEEFLASIAKDASELLAKLQDREAELVEELKTNREMQRALRGVSTREATATFQVHSELKAAIEDATPETETNVLAELVKKKRARLPELVQFILERVQQPASAEDLHTFLKDAKWRGSSELVRTTLYRMTQRKVLFRDVTQDGPVFGLAEWKKKAPKLLPSP